MNKFSTKLATGGSIVVGHLTADPAIEGSNPVLGENGGKNRYSTTPTKNIL
jgi:hypothetical protein